MEENNKLYKKLPFELKMEYLFGWQAIMASERTHLIFTALVLLSFACTGIIIDALWLSVIGIVYSLFSLWHSGKETDNLILRLDKGYYKKLLESKKR